MEIHYLEIDGAPSLFERRPALEIIWHKTSKEIYCHTAQLLMDSSTKENLVRVSIKTKTIISPASTNRRVIESDIFRYLPIRHIDGKTNVPLHSTELVEALERCEFTKDSKGANKYLVRYPTAITLSYADREDSYSFTDELPPFLICKNLLETLEIDDKIVTRINL